MVKLSVVLKKIKNKLDTDSSIRKQVLHIIDDVYNQVVNHALQSNLGYCTRFKIPLTKIESIIDIIGIDKDEYNQALSFTWGFKLGQARMAEYAGYQSLLVLIYYFLAVNNEEYAKKTLFLLLANLWNGRMKTYFPSSCDPDTMAYVVQYMVGRQSLVAKYESPLTLLLDHFVPTLLKAYGKQVVSDPDTYLKRLFAQAYSRIFQVFYSRQKLSLSGGSKNKFMSGLATYYYKAKEEGLSIKKVQSDEAAEAFTGSLYEQMSNEISSQFVLNYPKYPESFIRMVSDITLLKPKSLEILAERMHDPKHQDFIKETTARLFRAMGITDKLDLCKKTDKQLYQEVRYLLISARNTYARDLQSYINLNLPKFILGSPLEVLPQRSYLSIRVAICCFILYHAKKVYCERI